MYAAIIGVSSRATSSDARIASTAVQPNCLKNLPGMPAMKAVGRNTATSAKVVATTARPISSAASIAAWYGLLPMCKWRSMFSISTIASSTRMPTTSAIDKSVTVFSVKPNRWMPRNAGITDSGRAAALISVARQSRRNAHTTITASRPPS